MNEGKILLLTGVRGAGKTSLCQKLIAQAKQAGWRVTGALSPARFEDDIKTGIWLEDAASGEQRLLARLAQPEDDGLRTTRWAFDAEVMAWGNELLAHATPTDLLVVDELGPLELERGEGWQAGIQAVDGGEFRLAVVVVRTELLPLLQARWQTAHAFAAPYRREIGFALWVDPRTGEWELRLGQP